MRDLKRIIIHCSATPEGRDFGVDQIKLWHLNRGWSDVGYHFVIRLDGLVEEGRPISRPGAHTRGHNEDSIGICYVGGVDDDHNPKDTRTPEQKTALIKLVQDLRDEYGPLLLNGHNDFSDKACPSFNVREELSSFRKFPRRQYHSHSDQYVLPL